MSNTEMKIERINVNDLGFFDDFIIDNDLTIIIETRKNPYGVKYLLAYIEGSDVVACFILNLLRDKISGKVVKGIQVPTLRKT